MAKEVVDQGGFIQLSGGGSGGLFDGTGVQQASLVRTITTVDVTASGDTHTVEKPLRRSYELTGTAYLDGSNLFSLGDTCTATYYAQSFGTPLFQGVVLVTRVSDLQQQGGFETQSIALRSTGTPTVG
jgi:hypothetical protein